MSVSFGDLKVKMGMDLSQLDAGAHRAISKLRSIGQGFDDPKIGLDSRAFDQKSTAVQKTLQDIARRDATVTITADTSTAEGRAQRLQAVLAGVTDAQYVAKVAVDTEVAYQELLDLQRLFDRMDQTEEVIKVRADVDQALKDLGHFRQELEEIDGASVGLSTRLAGLGGQLGGIARTALGVAGGIGIANAATALMSRSWDFVTDAVLGANVELENASAKLMAFTKDGAETSRILEEIRSEAELTPFAFQDMADAVAAIYPVAKRANEPLMDLVRTAEILAASNPAEGLAGAAFALKEAASGDFQSAIERFNLARSYINQLKDEGVPNLEILRRAIQDAGYDITLVSNLSQTASGKWSTFMDALRDAGRRIGSPIFEGLKEGLDGLIAFTETERFSEMVDEWTVKVGDMADAFSGFVVNQGPGIIGFFTESARVIADTAKEIDDLKNAALAVLDVLDDLDTGTQGLDTGGLPTPAPKPGGGGGGFPVPNIPTPVDVFKEVIQTYQQMDAITEDYTGRLNNLTDEQIRHIQATANLSGTLSENEFFQRELARAYLEAIPANQEYLNHLKRMEETLPPLSSALANMSAEQIMANQRVTEAGPAQQAFAEHLRQVNTAVENQTQTLQERAEAMGSQSRFMQAVADGNMSTAQAANDYTYVEAAANVVRLEAAAFARNLAEQQQGLAGAYQSGLGALTAYSQQAGEYRNQASAVEQAVESLQKRQENGEQLSEREIALLENKDEILGRLNGGVEDATIQAGLAAGANGLLMQAQDELNRALQDGEIDQETYNQKLRDAQALYGDPAQTDPMQESVNTLSDVISTNLIGSIDNLTRKIEYISKPWLVEIDAATEAAEAELLRIIGLINQINSSSAAPYMPGMGDSGAGQPMAEGGIVDAPTLALIGEAGPELVLPLSKPERMKTLLAQAGIPAWADGGGVMPGVGSYGPPTSGGAGITLDVRVNVEPIDFAFLFAGIDREAEDWGAQAGKKFIGFFKGNIADLATGDMLADARAELEDLFTIREIAIDSGAPAEVIAQIDAEIQAQSDTVNAIGASMGTDVVKGIADSIASGEAAQLLSEFREGVFDGLDLSGAGVLNLEETIAQMTALRDAALEMGDTAQADRLTADIAALNGELTLSNQILETDAVQAWQAAEDAAAAAAAQAEAYADAAASVADPGALEGKLQAARDAEIALQVALADGADPETIADLQAKYDAAVGAVIDFEDALRTAVEAGILTEDELMAHAQQGGQALQTILQSGALSDEQIRELVESGDEAVRGILEAFFGENTIAAWEDGWDNISEADYAALLAMEPKGEEMSDQWVSGVLTGLQNGRLSIAQAMELLTDEAGEISDEAAQSLLDTWRQVGADLDQAMATGENLDEARLAYDQFMVFLEELALASGMTVEEIIAHFEKIEAAALQTESTLQGVSMAFGGSPDAVSGLQKLEQAIRDADEAAREADAAPIIDAWEDGLITLDEARATLEALGDEMDEVGDSASRAEQAVRKLSGSLEQAIVDSFIFAGQPGARTPAQYEQILDGLLGRMDEAMALDPEGFADDFAAAFERIQDALQEATLLGRKDDVARLTATWQEMARVASVLGIDIGEALGISISTGVAKTAKLAATTARVSLPDMTGISNQVSAFTQGMVAYTAPMIPSTATAAGLGTPALDYDLLTAAMRSAVEQGSRIGTADGAERGMVKAMPAIASGIERRFMPPRLLTRG